MTLKCWSKFPTLKLLCYFFQNLRLYRHPDILKFINFTQHQKLFYLFTEKISPLTVVQNQQNLHQISLGLQKILKSLIFLHKVGNLAHTNLWWDSCQRLGFLVVSLFRNNKVYSSWNDPAKHIKICQIFIVQKFKQVNM